MGCMAVVVESVEQTARRSSSLPAVVRSAHRHPAGMRPLLLSIIASLSLWSADSDHEADTIARLRTRVDELTHIAQVARGTAFTLSLKLAEAENETSRLAGLLGADPPALTILRREAPALANALTTMVRREADIDRLPAIVALAQAVTAAATPDQAEAARQAHARERAAALAADRAWTAARDEVRRPTGSDRF
jgi:hypothetical protein